MKTNTVNRWPIRVTFGTAGFVKDWQDMLAKDGEVRALARIAILERRIV